MTINYGKFVLYIFLVAINLVYGLSRQNRKIHIKGSIISVDLGETIAFLLLVYLMVLAITDTDNPDYYNYLSKYEGTSLYVSVTEVGYSYISDLSKNIFHLTFTNFKLVIYTFCGISIWQFFSRIKVDKNTVFGLYALFPFAYDAIQMRNFLCFCILLMFLPALLSGRKKGIIIFLIGIIISFTIHYMGIIYALFLLIAFNKEEEAKNKRQRLLILAFTVSTILVVLMKMFPTVGNAVLYYLSSGMDDVRKNHYFLRTSNWGFLIFICLGVLFIFTAKKCKELLNEKCSDSHCVSLANNLYWMNLALGCSFPLLVVNVGFYRIIRNLLMINYCIPFFISRCEKSRRSQIVYILFVIAFLANCIWTYSSESVDVFWCFFN